MTDLVISIFLIIALGFLFKKIGFIDDKGREVINRFAYYVGVPALTFGSIAKFDFVSVFNGGQIIGFALAIVTVFAFSLLISLFFPKRKQRGVLIMCGMRGNLSYLGLPVIMGAFGEIGVGKAALLEGFTMPFIIVLSVLALEMNKETGDLGNPDNFGGSENSGYFEHSGNSENLASIKNSGNAGYASVLSTVGRRLILFAKNPIVISSFLGLIASFLKIPVMNIGPVSSALGILGSLSLPLSLLAVGSSISPGGLRGLALPTIITTAIKLFLLPLVGLLIYRYFIPVPDLELNVAVILLAMPTAVSSYVMTKELGGDEELNASIITFSTLLSLFSLIFWIGVL